MPTITNPTPAWRTLNISSAPQPVTLKPRLFGAMEPSLGDTEGGN
jgi:hypothetical protein